MLIIHVIFIWGTFNKYISNIIDGTILAASPINAVFKNNFDLLNIKKIINMYIIDWNHNVPTIWMKNNKNNVNSFPIFIFIIKSIGIIKYRKYLATKITNTSLCSDSSFFKNSFFILSPN